MEQAGYPFEVRPANIDEPTEARLGDCRHYVGELAWLKAEAVARKYDPDAKVSGVFVLLTFLIDSLMSDQVTSFLYASIGLLLVMTLAFRSLKLGLVGLLPNVFPIVLVIGGMGWADVPVNIATAMITCVSLGLTVDFFNKHLG